MNKLISLLYSLLIGASIVTFVGLGAYAFYPSPEFEDDCYDAYQYYDANLQQEPAAGSDEKFEECQAEQEAERQEHAQGVAIIALAATAIITAGALLAPLTITEIKDGVALGAAMTAVYATIWAGISQHRVLLFLSGTLFLVSAIATGYAKFKD